MIDKKYMSIRLSLMHLRGCFAAWHGVAKACGKVSLRTEAVAWVIKEIDDIAGMMKTREEDDGQEVAGIDESTQ